MSMEMGFEKLKLRHIPIRGIPKQCFFIEVNKKKLRGKNRK